MHVPLQLYWYTEIRWIFATALKYIQNLSPSNQLCLLKWHPHKKWSEKIMFWLQNKYWNIKGMGKGENCERIESWVLCFPLAPSTPHFPYFVNFNSYLLYCNFQPFRTQNTMFMFSFCHKSLLHNHSIYMSLFYHSSVQYRWTVSWCNFA
jgi:hypothetical protein